MEKVYDNACIYVLEGGPHLYVGCTRRPHALKQRLAEHRYNYACFKSNTGRPLNCSVPCFEYDDVSIRPIESHSNITSKNLQARETFFINKLKCINIQQKRRV